eukprot:5164041-Alexandrium_andersonii.AAC.1
MCIRDRSGASCPRPIGRTASAPAHARPGQPRNGHGQLPQPRGPGAPAESGLLAQWPRKAWRRLPQTPPK